MQLPNIFFLTQHSWGRSIPALSCFYLKLCRQDCLTYTEFYHREETKHLCQSCIESCKDANELKKFIWFNRRIWPWKIQFHQTVSEKRMRVKQAHLLVWYLQTTDKILYKLSLILLSKSRLKIWLKFCLWIRLSHGRADQPDVCLHDVFSTCHIKHCRGPGSIRWLSWGACTFSKNTMF